MEAVHKQVCIFIWHISNVLVSFCLKKFKLIFQAARKN